MAYGSRSWILPECNNERKVPAVIIDAESRDDTCKGDSVRIVTDFLANDSADPSRHAEDRSVR